MISHDVLGLTSRLADNISANIIGLALGTIFRYLTYKRFVFTTQATDDASTYSSAEASPRFYPYLTGRQNLEGLALLDGGIRPGVLEETLEVVDLVGRADDKVGGYSYGMRQRLGMWLRELIRHLPVTASSGGSTVTRVGQRTQPAVVGGPPQDRHAGDDGADGQRQHGPEGLGQSSRVDRQHIVHAEDARKRDMTGA